MIKILKIKKFLKKSCFGSYNVSWCVTQFALLPKQHYLQMFITMRHWSGLRPLASSTLSILEPQ